MTAETTDRFRGGLVGTAVGHTRGAPVERHLHSPRDYLESLVDDPPGLTFADDTADYLAAR